jgi:hypothetical protein
MSGGARDRKETNMATLKGSNVWKAAGALLLLAMLLGVLFLAPTASKPSVGEPAVELPSMSHVPPPGSLKLGEE